MCQRYYDGSEFIGLVGFNEIDLGFVRAANPCIAWIGLTYANKRHCEKLLTSESKGIWAYVSLTKLLLNSSCSQCRRLRDMRLVRVYVKLVIIQSDLGHTDINKWVRRTDRL